MIDNILFFNRIHASAIPKEPGLLPPVLPMVLCNGRVRWAAPAEIAGLMEDGPIALGVYRPQLRYLLIDESAYADLAAQRNLAAALFRLERSRGPTQVQEVLVALADWLRAPEQRDLRQAFLIWLKQALLKVRLPGIELPELHDLEEMWAMLAERVVEWTEQWKQQGLQAERRLLLRQAQRRFSAPVAEQSTPLLARIQQPEQFEELGGIASGLPERCGLAGAAG